MYSASDWILQNAEQVVARQQSQVETAKILVGLTLGASVTLVATCLQVGSVSALDFISAILAVLTVLASVATIYFDRLREPDRTYVEGIADENGWTAAATLVLMRQIARATEELNEELLKPVILCAQIQVVLALSAITFALASLLVAQ